MYTIYTILYTNKAWGVILLKYKQHSITFTCQASTPRIIRMNSSTLELRLTRMDSSVYMITDTKEKTHKQTKNTKTNTRTIQ